MSFVTDQGESDRFEHSMGSFIEDIWTVPGALWAESGSPGKIQTFEESMLKWKFWNNI